MQHEYVFDIFQQFPSRLNILFVHLSLYLLLIINTLVISYKDIYYLKFENEVMYGEISDIHDDDTASNVLEKSYFKNII